MRRWLKWFAVGLTVVVLAATAIGGGLIWYARTHQDLELPPDGATLPTSLPVPGRETPGVLSSTLYVQQGLNRRRAAIYTPSGMRSGERLPVIVLLHGHSGNAGTVIAEGNWTPAIGAHRFVVIAPDGVAQSWNAGECCRFATTLGVDDTAFLEALVRDMARRDFVDAERVFMVGISNGGMMAYRFACERGDLIAGIASVAGTRLDDCVPERPMPILQVHGTDDRVVPYDGGHSAAGLVVSGTSFPPVESSMARLAAQLHCEADPETTSSVSRVVVREWTGCGGAGRVELDTVRGLAHQWPRGAPLDATERILEFFGLTG